MLGLLARKQTTTSFTVQGLVLQGCGADLDPAWSQTDSSRTVWLVWRPYGNLWGWGVDRLLKKTNPRTQAERHLPSVSSQIFMHFKHKLCCEVQPCTNGSSIKEEQRCWGWICVGINVQYGLSCSGFVQHDIFCPSHAMQPNLHVSPTGNQNHCKLD